MNDPTDLHTQEADEATQRRNADFLAKREVEDLKWLMAHKQGRRLAWGLLSDAGIFRNPFNHSGSITAFNCGQMNLGQQLLAKIMEHAPEAYVVMTKEQKAHDN